MMKFEIKPYESVGEIIFGEEREMVRTKLNLPYKPQTIRMTASYSIIQDTYPSLRIKVFYNGNNLVEAIEFFKPGVIFNDLDLLKSEYSFLLDYFKKNDPDIEVEKETFTSPKYGITIGAKTKDGEILNKLESVVVFNKEYRDRSLPSVDDLINDFLNKGKSE